MKPAAALSTGLPWHAVWAAGAGKGLVGLQHSGCRCVQLFSLLSFHTSQAAPRACLPDHDDGFVIQAWGSILGAHKLGSRLPSSLCAIGVVRTATVTL
jgi:hypothetical protein